MATCQKPTFGYITITPVFCGKTQDDYEVLSLYICRNPIFRIVLNVQSVYISIGSVWIMIVSPSKFLTTISKLRMLICAIRSFENLSSFMIVIYNKLPISIAWKCARQIEPVTHAIWMSHVMTLFYREYYNHQSSQCDKPTIQPQLMELFAVVCIATSHYVSFTK